MSATEGAACVTSERSAPLFSLHFPLPFAPPRPRRECRRTPAGGISSPGPRDRTDSTPNSPRSIVTRFHADTAALFFLSSLAPPLPAPSGYLPPVRTVVIPSSDTAGSGIRRETGRATSRVREGKKKRQIGPPRAANFTPRSISPNGAEGCARRRGKRVRLRGSGARPSSRRVIRDTVRGNPGTR